MRWVRDRLRWQHAGALVIIVALVGQLVGWGGSSGEPTGPIAAAGIDTPFEEIGLERNVPDLAEPGADVGAPEAEREVTPVEPAPPAAVAEVATTSTTAPPEPPPAPAASPEPTVPPTTTVAPTTTLAPVEAIPAGTWDAQVAGASAGATTSNVTASGVHVGPGQTYTTISDAVAAAPAGSTVIVHDNGDAYREAFSTDRGWIGKPLRIVAAPGERPVVSGADIIDAWSADGTRWFHQYDGDRLEFALPVGDDIIRDQLSPSAPFAGLLEQVRIDAVSLVQVGSIDALVPGTFFVDRDADRIVLADDPTGRIVEVAARNRALMLAPGAAGTSIEGLTITGFAPRHVDGTAMVVIDQASDVVLRDVVLSHSSATGLLAVVADRLLLERVSMIDNGARGMSGDRLDTVTIRRSRVAGNNTERFDHQDCGGGTYCVLAGVKLTRSAGIEVTHSAFVDNRSTGFWCDLECRSLVFVANHVVGNAKHGAYFEVSEGAVIEANVLAGNAEAGVKASGSRELRIAHNTFFDNGMHVNVGADYRPASIGFHTSPETHMRAIDLVANVFAEATVRRVVIDPVNHDTAPNPWTRLGNVTGNLYLLTDGVDGSDWRFRLDDGRFVTDPAEAVAPSAVVVGDPASHFDGGGVTDLRLVGDVARVGSAPLSATAAAFFPPLGGLPPGAPLG